MRIMKRSVVLLGSFLLLGGLSLGNRAEAMSLAPGGSVAFDNGGGLTGNVSWVTSVSGLPSGANVLAGSVGGSDTTLVFDIGVTGGSLTDLTIQSIQCQPGPPPNACGTFFGLLSSTAAGWVPGPDVDLSSVSGPANARKFAFGAIGAGQMSDQIFLSFAGGIGNDTYLTLVTGPAGPNPATTVHLVPEPASGLLLGLGVGGLAWARRRRS